MNATPVEEITRIKIDPVPRMVNLPPMAGRAPRRSRRQRKVVRFLIWESAALAALLGCLLGGTSTQFARESLTTPFAAGILLTAAALALIPVLFFALPRRRETFRR